jgi:hypothetical protein
MNIPPADLRKLLRGEILKGGCPTCSGDICYHEALVVLCLDCDWQKPALELWDEIMARIKEVLKPFATQSIHPMLSTKGMYAGATVGDFKDAAELYKELTQEEP